MYLGGGVIAEGCGGQTAFNRFRSSVPAESQASCSKSSTDAGEHDKRAEDIFLVQDEPPMAGEKWAEVSNRK